MQNTENYVRQDDAVQNAVKNLFLGCTPERAAELEELWQLLDPKFQMVGNEHEGGRVILDAGAYRYVRYNHRVLRAFWIGAFAAWEGYRAVAEAYDVEAVDLTKLVLLIAAFDKILSSDDAEAELLPDGIPEPGVYVDKETDAPARAAAELATMAVGWVLLHEVRHIKHQQENTGADPYGDEPGPFHAEELSCDEFATRFLLEGIEAYATANNVSADLVRRKREMAIYFALFAVTLLTDGKWGDSKSHPSVQRRIDAVTALMGDQRNEIAEAIAHVAFATLHVIWPDAPSVRAS